MKLFSRSVFMFLLFGILLGASSFFLPLEQASAAVCPPGSNNEGANTNFTDPDSIEAFCDQNPEETATTDQPTDGCRNGGSFFGLPPWHKYLEKQTRFDDALGTNVCDVKISGISDVWLIVAAVIEILLRIGSLVAIGFVIFGGATYIMSQGQPDKTKQALMTIINALVGLVITIVAAAMVSFIAGRF